RVAPERALAQSRDRGARLWHSRSALSLPLDPEPPRHRTRRMPKAVRSLAAGVTASVRRTHAAAIARESPTARLWTTISTAPWSCSMRTPTSLLAFGRFEHDHRNAAIGRPRLVVLVAGVELRREVPQTLTLGAFGLAGDVALGPTVSGGFDLGVRLQVVI